jgi:hypothetical protein
MPTHLTYEDALSQDPQMSRLIMAIQTAGTPTKSPSHREPTAKMLSACQLHRSDTRSAHCAHCVHPILLSPSIQEGKLTNSHPLPQPTVFLDRAPPKEPVPQLLTITPTRYRSPPAKPKAYPLPSDDGFSNGEIDHLINLFEDLSTDTPSLPPQGICVTSSVFHIF